MNKIVSETEIKSLRIGVSKLTNDELDIIRAIGETGVYKEKEVQNMYQYKEVSEEDKDLFKEYIKEMIESIIRKGFLYAEMIDLKTKDEYNLFVFSLNQKGKKLYRDLTGKEALKSKYEENKEEKDSNKAFFEDEFLETVKDEGYEKVEKEKEKIYDLLIGKEKETEKVIVNFDNKNDLELYGKINSYYDSVREEIEGPVNVYLLANNDAQLIAQTKRIAYLWVKEKFGGFKAAKNKVVFNFSTLHRAKTKKPFEWETKKI